MEKGKQRLRILYLQEQERQSGYNIAMPATIRIFQKSAFIAVKTDLYLYAT